MSSNDDESFLAAVESGTFPLAQWTHRIHVRVAFLYLSRESLDTAIARIRTTIQAYNAAHQVPEALDRGYHETITQAFMRLIVLLMEQCPSATFEQFCERNPELLDRKILLRFYSRERLMSAAAKRGFCEPDLRPLESTASTRHEAPLSS